MEESFPLDVPQEEEDAESYLLLKYNFELGTAIDFHCMFQLSDDDGLLFNYWPAILDRLENDMNESAIARLQKICQALGLRHSSALDFVNFVACVAHAKPDDAEDESRRDDCWTNQFADALAAELQEPTSTYPTNSTVQLPLDAFCGFYRGTEEAQQAILASGEELGVLSRQVRRREVNFAVTNAIDAWLAADEQVLSGEEEQVRALLAELDIATQNGYSELCCGNYSISNAAMSCELRGFSVVAAASVGDSRGGLDDMSLHIDGNEAINYFCTGSGYPDREIFDAKLDNLAAAASLSRRTLVAFLLVCAQAAMPYDNHFGDPDGDYDASLAYQRVDDWLGLDEEEEQEEEEEEGEEEEEEDQEDEVED